MRTYYRLWLRLDGAERWMLWHTDDDAPDGVWIDASGGIPLFSSSASLDRFAVRLGITLASDPPILHDLDVITQWLSDPRRDTVDCDAFLAAWNLFSDVAVTVGAELPDQGEPANTIYKKLFWGCNPPSVTPPGSYYVPEWTPAELPTLRQILAFGFSLMRPRLKPVP
jgi:hypothetical protein